MNQSVVRSGLLLAVLSLPFSAANAADASAPSWSKIGTSVRQDAAQVGGRISQDAGELGSTVKRKAVSVGHSVAKGADHAGQWVKRHAEGAGRSVASGARAVSSGIEHAVTPDPRSAPAPIEAGTK